MSEVERVIYRVEPGSPVMAVIEKAEARRKALGEAVENFKTEMGASSAIISPHRFLGLLFDGDAPVGWRRASGNGLQYHKPDQRTKEGKKIAAAVAKFPTAMSGLDIGDELDGKFTHWGDGVVAWPGYGLYDGVYIFSVPLACKAVPEGCVELKQSEYWLLVEAAKEKLAAKKAAGE